MENVNNYDFKTLLKKLEKEKFEVKVKALMDVICNVIWHFVDKLFIHMFQMFVS